MLCYFETTEHEQNIIINEVPIALCLEGKTVMPIDCMSMLRGYIPTNVQIISFTALCITKIKELDNLVSQADLHAHEQDTGYVELFEQYEKLFGDKYPMLLHVLKHHVCDSLLEFTECL